MPTNYLYMHPDDAAVRGIRDREVCQVRSGTGLVQVPVKLTEDMMQGQSRCRTAGGIKLRKV